MERICLAWDQISWETSRKLWQKLISLENDQTDNTEASIAVSKKEIIEQFSALNLDVSETEIDRFSEDGPGYEQGIVDLITAPENDDDEKENDGKITPIEAQQPQCSITNSKAMLMFDKCLTRLRFQLKATLTNTSTLVQLCKLAEEKQEENQKQTKIDK